MGHICEEWNMTESYIWVVACYAALMIIGIIGGGSITDDCDPNN